MRDHRSGSTRKSSRFQVEVRLGATQADEVGSAGHGMYHWDLIVKDQWYPVPCQYVLRPRGALA